MAETSNPQTHRRAVSYIDKSREYYAAHGYEQAYAWASYPTVPFTPLANGTRSTVGIVTTAHPMGAGKPKKAYAQASSPIPDAMFTKDLSWDKDATHTDDLGTFLPLAALNQLAADGEIGQASPRFYGIPTHYSQRATLKDADRILNWAKEDKVDLMLLVPL